jgi:orotidine-5'-phosphate decarboxylase
MTELWLALDLIRREEALSIASQCAPHIDGIKLGYPLILETGLGIAGALSPLGLPLIADFKVADIPNTNRLIAEAVFSAEFSAIICHGFTGRDAITVCVETAHSCGGACYVVAEMSHPGAVEFFHGGVAERITTLARECGADGIIAPATRPERVAALRRQAGSMKIYSPGVGAQGGDAGAIARLVDGIIVGRAIYGADDPATAARAFSDSRR